MITVAQAFSHIRHALGNSDPGAPLSLVEIVNAAGHELTGMHTWSWLDRTTDDYGIVAGQNYVSLPSDFGRLVYVEAADGSFTVEPAAQATVLRERSSGGNEAFCLKFYVGQSAPTTSSGPVARLEINWNTPAANADLLIAYRARWADVGTDTVACPVPDYMRPLFIEVLRATAQGWEEEQVASKTERMNAVYQSATFLAAKRIDDEQQFTYGPIRNGPVQFGAFERNVTYGSIEVVS